MSDLRDELKAMDAAVAALEPLDDEGRGRALQWLIRALGIEGAELPGTQAERAEADLAPPPPAPGSTGTPPTPRDFIAQKKPKTAVERMACLGYYLAHYRNTQTFKTNDLTSLNTEAAQPKFANPTRDVDNADRSSGYLAPAGGGARQLSLRGEALVLALPDRAAVKQALEEHPYRQKRAGKSTKKSASAEET